MSEKRKATTRATAASKKPRKSSPPEPAQKVATPKSATPVFEEGLPRSHTAGRPLPTLPDAQSEDLSIREYQSVAESGVLADSLLRSKQKWISEGIFEKYWTKPVKKKKEDTIEPPNNPARESMTKLGTCVITIEPHVFDATMYAVKNPSAPPQTPQQAARPVLQYGPPGGVVQQHQPHPSNFQVPSAPMQPGTVDQKLATPVNGSPSFNSTPSAGQNQPPMQPANGPSPAKSTDPVIQMLAERAATDQNLKALMRIVAGGSASPEELKQFQSHIDDLTRQLQTRPRLNSQTTGFPGQRFASTSNAHGTSTNQPQALRSKGPVPSKQDISAVVFEFAGGSGDRFLFPKYSILEYLPGNQVIASFLIVRKGSPEDSPYYDPQLDYYQPVTIRIFAQLARQLEILGKVVAPQEEVRRYMDDIMDNMTRAEYVLLAMRLPREKEQPSEPEPAPSNIMQPVMWVPTPNAIVSKSQARLYQTPQLTEEQMYQGFIATVS